MDPGLILSIQDSLAEAEAWMAGHGVTGEAAYRWTLAYWDFIQWSIMVSAVLILISSIDDLFIDLAAAEARGVKLAVLDVPLLFETGGDAAVDAVVVVTAPAAVQAERVLARSGMTRERFEAILARQRPDAEKRRRADFIIDTSMGLEAARARVEEIVGTVLAPGWTPPRQRP